MRSHAEVNVKVAPSARAAFPFSGKPEPHAGLNARGYFDFDLPLESDAPVAATGRARLLQRAAFPAAFRARARDYHEPGRLPDLARALAGCAGHALAARTFAGLAYFPARNGHGLCNAESGFLEIDFKRHFKVRAAAGPLGTSTQAPAEHPAEDFFKDRSADAGVFEDA